MQTIPMMKHLFPNNIRRIPLIIMLASSIICCEDDFLSENPKTFLDETTVFSNEAGAISATFGVYESLRDNVYYGQRLMAVLSQHADYGLGRGSQVPLGNYQLDALNIGRIGQMWAVIYASINRANIVIKNVPEVPDIEPQLADQLVAEARFLRALGYYHLVRLWGDVPLRLEPETVNFAIARTPTSEVYDQIIEDLQFGENNLPDSYPGSELGRITKWAAKALLADVFLTLERWSDAKTKAEEVINSGQFSLVLVETSEDFHTKMFGPSIPTHSEEIISIKYSLEQDNDSWIRFFHKAGPGYSFGGPHAILGNLDSFIGQGVWKDESSPDLRRNAFLYSGSDTIYLDQNIRMLFRKFRGAVPDLSNDTPILRYAEVLLIFAEATSQANGGPNPEAYEAINQVRRRAYGRQDLNSPDPSIDLSGGMTAEEFRDAVIMERAWELLNEGKRWYDLLRTNTTLEVIQPLGLPIMERNLKWPIAQEEIDNNEALTQADQNPGW